MVCTNTTYLLLTFQSNKKNTAININVNDEKLWRRTSCPNIASGLVKVSGFYPPPIWNRNRAQVPPTLLFSSPPPRLEFGQNFVLHFEPKNCAPGGGRVRDGSGSVGHHFWMDDTDDPFSSLGRVV